MVWCFFWVWSWSRLKSINNYLMDLHNVVFCTLDTHGPQGMNPNASFGDISFSLTFKCLNIYQIDCCENLHWHLWPLEDDDGFNSSSDIAWRWLNFSPRPTFDIRGSERNDSTNWFIAKKYDPDIHVPHKMNPNNFGDLLLSPSVNTGCIKRWRSNMLKLNGKKLDGKRDICSAFASENVSRQHLAQGTAVFATFSLKSAASVWRAASKSCHCNRLHHMHIHELIACQNTCHCEAVLQLFCCLTFCL